MYKTKNPKLVLYSQFLTFC